MKKLLTVLLFGVATVGVVNADQTQQMPSMMTDPVCQTAMEHMRTTHKEVEAAIKANDANKVGTLVIANHNYMESFMAKNPQCKPQRGMGMMPPAQGNNPQSN